MTSSLVGSEMCIRDRDIFLAVTRVSRAVRANEQAEDVEQRAIIQMRDTVSYTHLTLPTICSV
eukprot:6507520-Prorocentrum_lima.AAC.1